MTKLYRAMVKDEGNGKPARGRSRRYLGVRVGEDADIAVDEDGVVHPGEEGLSVNPESPRHLPEHKLPPQLGGRGEDPVWYIDDGDLGDELAFVPDPTADKPYGFIAPAYAMDADAYMDALWGTQAYWYEVSDEDYSRERAGANP
jgi:hypothetical protein